MDKIRVIELFAGIGATRVAVDRVAKKLNKEVEHVAICEIDKFAVRSYNAIFGETPNLGDITKVEKFPDCDLLSWTFPCTDLSKAGNCAGMEEGSGTRSALGWEVIRILRNTEHKPEWLLMENVPAVHNKKNLPEFERMIQALADMGYTSKWADMNAKDHGVAQNRNRCIMMSHLGEVKDFGMPRQNALCKVLRDYLEDEVGAEYFLTDKDLSRLCWKNEKNKVKNRGFNFTPRTEDSVAVSITTRSGQRETDNYVMCHEVANQNVPGRIESANRVYGVDALCPTLTTCQGGGQVKVIAEPIKVVNGDSKGYANAVDGDGVILGFYTGRETARGRVQKQSCPTLQTSINAGVVLYEGEHYRIRKLTPRECWRLFDRSDVEFDRAVQAGMSNSQLYKQAGNSIVVSVLEDALARVWGVEE